LGGGAHGQTRTPQGLVELASDGEGAPALLLSFSGYDTVDADGASSGVDTDTEGGADSRVNDAHTDSPMHRMRGGARHEAMGMAVVRFQMSHSPPPH
jgi:hypothetical protein